MKLFPILILSICYIIAFTENSYAYLDPGTGSMLLSAILGIVATLFFVLKNSYYKAKSFILGLFGMKIKQKSRYGIVFYSEGSQYWNTFKPIIAELSRRKIECAYLTSDKDDPGLNFPSDLVDKVYIGKGNSAFITLNMLEADVCALTTPGLDVLQIKKSRGVKHYTHIVHACTDFALYKLFSFDCYDSIMVSGEHQTNTLRIAEKLRKTHKKDVYEVGVPYMDVLSTKLKTFRETLKKTPKTNDHKTILIAPTWGNNGLLKMFGSEFIKKLLNTDYNIIIRPHPQSFISESSMIENLEQELKLYDNLKWDKSPDNFASLMNSDIMISDMSGIVFDYAFIFEKPVITMKFQPDWSGTDGYFIQQQAWELGLFNQIGKQISTDEMKYIDKIITELLNKETFKQDIIKLREKSLYNYGNVANIATNTLLKLHDANRGN